MKYPQFKKINYSHRWIAGLILFLSYQPVFAIEELNTNKQGIMLHGYDPVAYFMDFQPMLGWSAYQAEYQGGTYYFVSGQNREKFIANPAIYLPAYGGFCSYGVRMGKKFDIDPHAWKIVDGLLYVQLNRATHMIWSKDIPKNIEIADHIWPDIRPIPVATLLK